MLPADGSIGAQAVDDLSSADFAFLQRLKRDIDEAVIGGPTAAGKRNHICDGRIILDHATICRIESFIAGKDASCGPRTPPTIAPVSSAGKSPWES